MWLRCTGFGSFGSRLRPGCGHLRQPKVQNLGVAALGHEYVIRCNPFSGHLLVFCNRRSDRLKILYWDRDGWAIWYKRLEVGTFQFPFAETGRKEIAAWELGLLLEGIDLSKGQRRKRYSLPGSSPGWGVPSP